MIDVTHTHTIISNGDLLENAERIAHTVVGNKPIDAVFITTKVIIESDATSLSLFFLSSLIALSPSGVAALPSPNILALMFIDIYENAALFLSTSGNSL